MPRAPAPLCSCMTSACNLVGDLLPEGRGREGAKAHGPEMGLPLCVGSPATQGQDEIRSSCTKGAGAFSSSSERRSPARGGRSEGGAQEEPFTLAFPGGGLWHPPCWITALFLIARKARGESGSHRTPCSATPKAPRLFGSPAPCALHTALGVVLVFKSVAPVVIFLVTGFFLFLGFFCFLDRGSVLKRAAVGRVCR